MDGSAFRNMDLGRGFKWLLALAAIGMFALMVGGAFSLIWVANHVSISVQ